MTMKQNGGYRLEGQFALGLLLMNLIEFLRCLSTVTHHDPLLCGIDKCIL
jgi:hypothetical protein